MLSTKSVYISYIISLMYKYKDVGFFTDFCDFLCASVHDRFGIEILYQLMSKVTSGSSWYLSHLLRRIGIDYV